MPSRTSRAFGWKARAPWWAVGHDDRLVRLQLASLGQKRSQRR
jgi:hypothetical protein